MNRRMKIVWMLVFSFVWFTVFCNFALSASQELVEIQTAIVEKGASWTAGESWVTRLRPEERRKLLGENTLVSMNDETKETPPVPDQLPPAIDWRNKDGQNWITPVKDQQSCGSCVAFGSVATLESLVRIEQNQPDLDIDLSEMHLFNCGGGGCSIGWYNSAACAYLKNNGTPDEACWPYQPVDRPCSQTCPDWQSRAVKITNSGQISGIEACKNAVAIAPILVSFEVYSDFYSYSGGIYEHVWGGYEGGHAVSIVGYNVSGPVPYWIVKNSWGPFWGLSGFFAIKMGECNIENRSSYWMAGAILPEFPDVTISLTPDDIEIPRGGTLNYWAAANNNTDDTQCFYYWTNVKLPNGKRYPSSGELFGPKYLCLSAYASRSAYLSQSIPTGAPLGLYSYNAFIGPYPTIWDEDYFDFTVTTTIQEKGREDWKTTVEREFSD